MTYELTNEEVEAAARAKYDAWCNHIGLTLSEGNAPPEPCLRSYDDLGYRERDQLLAEARAALTAAAKVRGGVGVKELEWQNIGAVMWVAATPLRCPFQIDFDDLEQSYTAYQNTAGRRFEVGTFSTLEAAKDACQADFARRISECRTAPVVDRSAIEFHLATYAQNYAEGGKEPVSERVNAILSDIGATTREEVEREERERLAKMADDLDGEWVDDEDAACFAARVLRSQGGKTDGGAP